MRNKFTKQMLALVLSFSLIFSMAFVSSAESDTWTIDGSDKGEALPGDASETEPGDAADADGLDAGELLQDSAGTWAGGDSDARGSAVPFRVSDSRGAEFGRYGSWDALLAAFKESGSTAEEYTVTVSAEGVIGAAMPAQAGKLTLKPAEDGGVLTFGATTVNLAAALTIEPAVVAVAGSSNPLNINTKGKPLTLKGTENLGAVKGSASGSLILEGDIRLQGVLQTFKNVTVNGSLRLENHMSAVTNLNLENGSIYPAAGKNLTVVNVAAGENGTLLYPAQGVLPLVKISGTVTGELKLRQYAEENGEAVERYFTAGTKLLTASKARAEQFSVFGDKQICYKKGSAIYVGAEVLQLYAEDEYLGTYAQWSDMVAQINSRKQKGTAYRVVLTDDFTVTGALTMPGKGKYAGLAIENGAGERQLVLQATGSATLTANLKLGEGVSLGASAVSGAAWQLTMAEHTGLVTTQAVTVGTLVMGKEASLQAGGSFTVKKLLEADEAVTLILTQKKKAAVKDTNVYGNGFITVKIRDTHDNRVTLSPGVTVFTLSGSSYATQYRLLDSADGELALYRRGNALKVQGAVATPVTLYAAAKDGELSLGEYASLADVKTEIARRKEAKTSYRVEVREELFVKGAIPLPKAGTYKELIFTGQGIRTTGNITLTGDVVFANKVRKVKSEKDDTTLLWNVNVAKYTLSIPAESAMEHLGSVTGSAGSCLRIAAGAEQKVNGELKVATLVPGGTLQVTGNIVVTDICQETDSTLVYDLAKSVTIKGDITGDGTKLLLSPLKNGQPQTAYTEGQKILNSVPKANISRLQMAQAIDYVLYRESGAVKLGTPIVTVFADTLDYESCIDAASDGHPGFVRINDAIDYINSAASVDFVVRMDRDVPSAGAFTQPAKGKQLVLCGAGPKERTLALSGSITLDGSSLAVRNVKLDNKTSAGPGVILQNGASLWLYETGIGALNASEGTAVTLEGRVDIKGAVSGACDLTVSENAVVCGLGNVAARTLTLKAAPDAEGYAQFRLLTGKTITVSGEINTGSKGYFIVNQVDKADALAGIGASTVLVNTQYGEASQFKTQNIIPGTFERWSLIKSGTTIRTKADMAADDGKWSGDYL